MTVPLWVRKAAPGVLVCVALMVAMPWLRQWLGFSRDTSKAIGFGLMMFANSHGRGAWREYGTSSSAEKARRRAEEERTQQQAGHE